MRALVMTDVGVVVVREEPDPSAGLDETLISVQASGICGSELHGFRKPGLRVPPLIMGHEFAGVTEGGERVVVNPMLTCGSCAACLDHRPQICVSRKLIGVHRQGGFGEMVAVPNGNLYGLPDDVDWTAAALIEPLANAVHAWSHVGTTPDRVAVIGAGPIGLVCGLVAAASGARVMAYDVSETRRRVAETLGFGTGASPAIGETFAAVIDAVGLEETRRSSVDHTSPGGTAIWLGLAADTGQVPGSDVVRGEKKIVGSFAYSDIEFEAAVSLASSLDLSWASGVALGRSAEVFYALANGESDLIKAVLVPER